MISRPWRHWVMSEASIVTARGRGAAGTPLAEAQDAVSVLGCTGSPTAKGCPAHMSVVLMLRDPGLD